MYYGECPGFSRRSWQTCRLQSLRQRFEKPQTTTIISRVATGNWCDGYDLFNGRWVVAQRGLRSIMERRYRERRVEIKEKVHDEVEEKKKKRNGQRRLKDSCAVEESGCKPTSLKTCVLCKPWQGRACIELMVQRTHSASAACCANGTVSAVKKAQKCSRKLRTSRRVHEGKRTSGMMPTKFCSQES